MARSRISSSIVPFDTSLFFGQHQDAIRKSTRLPENADMALLTNTMCSGHGLQVVLRIVVRLQNQRHQPRYQICRLQQLTSKMITVSAVSKLIPRPPALVDNKNAKSGEPGALKCSIDFFLTSEGTVPSNR